MDHEVALMASFFFFFAHAHISMIMFHENDIFFQSLWAPFAGLKLNVDQVE
jgi:uncharacterized membrane protein YobD (UPF0266 family)